MRLKDELNAEVGVESQIRLGGIRELRVIVDGKTIFSNREQKRLPNPGEIADIIRSLKDNQIKSGKENG